MTINKQKIRILALICFFGLQPMPARAKVNDWMNLAMAYLLENKPFALTVAALLTLCMYEIICKNKIDRNIGMNADKVEGILNSYRYAQARTEPYDQKLFQETQKMKIILTCYKYEHKQNDLPVLLQNPDVKRECIKRKELHIKEELKKIKLIKDEYSIFKTFCADFMSKDELSVWSENTSYLQTSLPKILDELTLEDSFELILSGSSKQKK